MAKNGKIFSGKKGSGEGYKYKGAEDIKRARIEAARARDRAYRKAKLDARKDLFKEYRNAINPDFDMTDEQRADAKYKFIKSIHEMVDEETEKSFDHYDSEGIADVIRQVEEDVEDVEYLTAKDFKIALKKDKEKGNAGRKGSLNFF